MTARLVLLRHARAAPSAGPDLLRPLTDAGLAQARAQGERLRERPPTGPVLSSPASRCLQTAAEVCSALGREDVIAVKSELLEFAGVAGMSRLLGDVEAGGLLVGHQPSLADLACSLLRCTTLSFAFSPATAVILEREAGEPWTLAAVLAPA